MLEGDEIAWHSKSDLGPSETKSLADNVDADGDTESNTDGSTGGCSLSDNDKSSPIPGL